MTIFEISFFGLNIAPTWYWLMYALGFIICYTFLSKSLKIEQSKLDILLIYVFFWVVIGWRVWYIIFYNISYYISNIDEIFAIWKGGMSFHGWLLWVILALYLYSRKYRIWFFLIADHLAIIIPVALWLGRLGNYINWELLWYPEYTGPLAIVSDGISYFPSTLLEMLLEWMVLFSILFFLSKKYSQILNTPWFMSWIFLGLYGFFRLIAESFRLPDSHIWYLLGTDWITLGMLYTLPMLIGSLYLALRKTR